MIKLYGPYTDSNTGRQVVILFDLEKRTRRTQSYPRYLMEQHLGRELLPSEHVDHINEDSGDNRIENLQILTQAANNQKHVDLCGKTAKRYYFDCPMCGVATSTPYRYYRHNQLSQGKAGPYCSRACAGKAHH